MASAVRISDAMPAAGIAWPIIDFTVPITRPVRRTSAIPEERFDRIELSLIAYRRTGAMGFQVAEGSRVDLRVSICPFKRPSPAQPMMVRRSPCHAHRSSCPYRE